ncbi:HEPN domain-containing protein [Acidisphaera rubrifaciens]|uniref:Uncharacterized protein n=1 Tax=Acidisphaera rubrifaciens HS-AP3 TaxID=1231350 RepID=A0A0D6P3C1_9PROT|nr:HEPN domain-containing protein [Acidisphaera rubrifaciens]GAN76147.1 hypothetical protein Asru_0063_04 [Acidisphaera rubrifaciens HS-AP3]
MSEHDAAPLSYAALKTKQKLLRDGFPASLGLRTHRALSWLCRAERETDDDDVRFILLWIGFNAAYAADLRATQAGERSAFADYFRTLIGLDAEGRIHALLWNRFPLEISLLLENKYVFAPFWSHHNGADGYADWERRLVDSQAVSRRALESHDTCKVLSIVFDRLYVLRNQIMHGGATWNSRVNRNQVHDGADVLGWLLPVFIDIMLDHGDHDWGPPYYPNLP